MENLIAGVKCRPLQPPNLSLSGGHWRSKLSLKEKFQVTKGNFQLELQSRKNTKCGLKKGDKQQAPGCPAPGAPLRCLSQGYGQFISSIQASPKGNTYIITLTRGGKIISLKLRNTTFHSHKISRQLL